VPTTEQVRAVVDRYAAAVSAAAKNAILACFSEEASVVDP